MPKYENYLNIDAKIWKLFKYWCQNSEKYLNIDAKIVKNI